MRALITGVAGQDGTLLSKKLFELGWEITGTKLESEILHQDNPLEMSSVTDLDVTDFGSVKRIVSAIKPEVIFHLAGISSVGFSIKNPELTKSVNVGGVANFLNVLATDDFRDTHFIHAASTEIFDASSGVVNENSPLGPQSPYAESKAEAYQLCIKARNNSLPVTNAILSNHESYLRPVDFVTGKIANGVAKISLGLADHIKLGNIDVEKDWSSADDVVQGLIEIASNRFVGDVILASGKSTNLADIIREALAYVGISNWQDYITTDQSLIRANESKEIRIDPSLARSVLGWEAITPVSEWVGQMVEFHIRELNESQ